MAARFVVEIGVRPVIKDTHKGNRLAAYFPVDQDNPEAAANMARVCCEALNFVHVSRRGDKK